MEEKKVAIFFAEGFEEVEALVAVDLLRRAKIKVDMVSITLQRMVEGGHGITIMTDRVLKEIDFALYDGFLLPGGMPGTTHLGQSDLLMDSIKEQAEKGKLVAAICAAPSLLGELGILKGKRACCYPGFEEKLIGASVVYKKVEVDGNLITSRGVGTAIDFSLALISKLMGKEISDQIAKAILV